jgi:hypothetical protein
MALANAEIIMDAIMVIYGAIILLIGVLMLVVSFLLIKGRISRKGNMGIGFRTREAKASDEAWYRINRDGGKLMILPSLAFMASGLLLVLCPFLAPGLRDAVVLVVLACAIVTALLLGGYVLWVRRNEPGRKAA